MNIIYFKLIGYELNNHETNNGLKCFPSIIYVKLGEVDLKPIIDRDLIDEVRVFLFKIHNHITV